MCPTSSAACSTAVVSSPTVGPSIGPTPISVISARSRQLPARWFGWEFRLVGEPDPVWAANLRWLAGYRHPRFADPGLEELLVSAFAQPRPLAETAGQAGDSIRVLPVMFHLLWLGRLTGDLSRPLGNGTILAASTDPLEAT